MQNTRIHGVIEHKNSTRKTDFLFRISIKAIIVNDKGEVLVVKESGRSYWDLPGGGMDHGESIKGAIARELLEEVSLKCNFTYRSIATEDPKLLEHSSILQVRVIFHVVPVSMEFYAGEDSDEVAFKDPRQFKDSDINAERYIYDYSQLIKQ